MFSAGKEPDRYTVFQHKPTKEKHRIRQRSDMEKIICSPRGTNREQKQFLSPFPSMLRVSQDKNIIQINNHMTTLAMAKEQYGFSEEGETLRCHSQTKSKTFY